MKVNLRRVGRLLLLSLWTMAAQLQRIRLSGPGTRPYYAKRGVRVQRRLHHRSGLEPVELPERRGLSNHRQSVSLRFS